MCSVLVTDAQGCLLRRGYIFHPCVNKSNRQLYRLLRLSTGVFNVLTDISQTFCVQTIVLCAIDKPKDTLAELSTDLPNLS
jgi:hypothetical protein